MLFLVELTQIKYCFQQLQLRSKSQIKSEKNVDHKQTITDILHVKENGLTGTPVWAPYRSNKVTFPDGLPVSKILFTSRVLLDQMRKMYEKYIVTFATYEINISHDIRRALHTFFDDPATFIDSHFSVNNDVKPDDAIVNIFDSAALQILSVIRDTNQRFLQSSKMIQQRIVKFNDKYNNETNDELNSFDKHHMINNSNLSTPLLPKTDILNNDPSSKDTVANQWTVHEIIGKGGFGIVHRGTNLYTNKDVALKFIIKNASKYHQQTALNEIKILKQLTRISHPNVIELNFQPYKRWTRV